MSLFLLIDEKTIAFLIYVISLSIIESNFLIIMVHYFMKSNKYMEILFSFCRIEFDGLNSS